MSFLPTDIVAMIMAWGTDPLLLGLALAAFTFLTEDGALVAGSLMAGSGHMGQFEIIFWLIGGILIGDIILYLVGALARESRYVQRMLPARRLVKIRRWLSGRQSLVLFSTRFLPGTRLPTYLAYGYLRLSLARFSVVLLLAGSVWVTSIVLFVSETQAFFAKTHGLLGMAIGIGVAVLLIVVLPWGVRKLVAAPVFVRSHLRDHPHA